LDAGQRGWGKLLVLNMNEKRTGLKHAAGHHTIIML